MAPAAIAIWCAESQPPGSLVPRKPAARTESADHLDSSPECRSFFLQLVLSSFNLRLRNPVEGFGYVALSLTEFRRLEHTAIGQVVCWAP